MAGTLLDTNILVYAFSDDDKAELAQALLDGAVLSVQALNEFALVARRRLGMSWPEVRSAIGQIRALAGRDPEPITVTVHALGVDIAERYQLNIYDSIMVAAALAAGCSVVLSEDMQSGLVIDGRLTIRNPFA